MTHDYGRNRRWQKEKENAANQAGDGLAARLLVAEGRCKLKGGHSWRCGEVRIAEWTDLRLIFD
jgi:hypothetical protein